MEESDIELPRRRICTTGCGRPANVCLCRFLPETPLPTQTKVVILHHPHEQRHRLATVPLLSKCLQNCEIIVGRKFKYGVSRTLDSLYDRASKGRDSPIDRAFYLFPGPNALPIHEIRTFSSNHQVLIVFDGTWNHAREMVAASVPFLSEFATAACLDFDLSADGGSIFNSELTLRKEPFGGCMSTMEAVARAMRFLEPNDNGVDVEKRVVEVLRAMVSLQTQFLHSSSNKTQSTK